MKKLIIAAMLLTAGVAHAEKWFEMPNKAGGKIILTEYKCETNEKGRMVIATLPEGDTVQGCWFYFTDMVHIKWDSGKVSSFSPNDFVAKESK